MNLILKLVFFVGLNSIFLATLAQAQRPLNALAIMPTSCASGDTEYRFFSFVNQSTYSTIKIFKNGVKINSVFFENEESGNTVILSADPKFENKALYLKFNRLKEKTETRAALGEATFLVLPSAMGGEIQCQTMTLDLTCQCLPPEEFVNLRTGSLNFGGHPEDVDVVLPEICEKWRN